MEAAFAVHVLRPDMGLSTSVLVLKYNKYNPPPLVLEVVLKYFLCKVHILVLVLRV